MKKSKGIIYILGLSVVILFWSTLSCVTRGRKSNDIWDEFGNRAVVELLNSSLGVKNEGLYWYHIYFSSYSVEDTDQDWLHFLIHCVSVKAPQGSLAHGTQPEEYYVEFFLSSEILESTRQERRGENVVLSMPMNENKQCEHFLYQARRTAVDAVAQAYPNMPKGFLRWDSLHGSIWNSRKGIVSVAIAVDVVDSRTAETDEYTVNEFRSTVQMDGNCTILGLERPEPMELEK